MAHGEVTEAFASNQKKADQNGGGVKNETLCVSNTLHAALLLLLPHPQELHRLSREDDPATMQHWGEATGLVCSFMKASGCSSNGAHNVSDQDNILFFLN